MNILEETPFKIEAKISKFNKKTNIIYSIVESYYNPCIDKNEIVKAQIKTCEILSVCKSDKKEISTNDHEITEVKLALNILN